VGEFSPYFRVCYQIVRLIDDNNTLKEYDKINNEEYSYKQKQYFDIFKATLQQAELESLFFNGLNGYNRYKKIIEKYGLFEPLLIDIQKNGLIKLLTQYAYMYQESAFCDNEMFYLYFEDVRKIFPTIKMEEINCVIDILIDFDVASVFYPNGRIRRVGINRMSFIDFNKKVSNIIKTKIEFMDQRKLELERSGDEEFERMTLEQIVDVEEQVKKLKDLNYINTIYAVLKYHIEYKTYCNYLLISK